jgi:hypothetical protein
MNMFDSEGRLLNKFYIARVRGNSLFEQYAVYYCESGIVTYIDRHSKDAIKLNAKWSGMQVVWV